MAKRSGDGAENDTGKMKLEAGAALQEIPDPLRSELLATFVSIGKNYREGRWEATCLNAGKLCEVVYSIIRGYADDNFPAEATKPKNMVVACQQLEQVDPAKLGRALRIQIPRMLLALYEIRNNRGIGHVGGDVDPNHMDAALVVAAAKWILADLVRAFHNLEPAEATQVVEALVERDIPLIWEIDGVKRVLDWTLSTSDKVLLLLYAEANPLSVEKVQAWAGYSNRSRFRSDVVQTLHDRALLHFGSDDLLHLSPTGVERVEKHLLN